MAKKKVITEETAVKEEDKSLFKSLDSLIQSQFNDVVDLSKVDGKVKTWYDTGIYALNYAMSEI